MAFADEPQGRSPLVLIVPVPGDDWRSYALADEG
jgi:hypothetical protein